jgi:hypothetical protein
MTDAAAPGAAPSAGGKAGAQIGDFAHVPARVLMSDYDVASDLVARCSARPHASEADSRDRAARAPWRERRGRQCCEPSPPRRPSDFSPGGDYRVTPPVASADFKTAIKLTCKSPPRSRPLAIGSWFVPSRWMRYHAASTTGSSTPKADSLRLTLCAKALNRCGDIRCAEG